ncbi:hypothetical protein JCM10450v2_003595 [Rhodotorula kratochvilovae]
MAEAIHDEHSPLAHFLRQSDSSEHSSADAPSARESSASPSTSRAPLPTASSTRAAAPPAPKRTRKQLASIERVKYAIATSALLSAKLADALQVYPPLEALQHRVPRSRPARTRSSSVRSTAKGKAKAADWGAGWDTRGQGVAERGVLGSAQAALSGLVGALGRFSARSEGTLQAVKEEDSGEREPEKEAAPRTPQDALLATVEEFIASSQELDLRVALALTAIKELECIAHGLGLSDPLPPISRIEARGYLSSPKPPSPTSATMMSTPSRSPRIPSPLGGPSRASPPLAADSEGPHPLRALALRTALSEALGSALTALSSATTALNALLPSDSPLLTLTAPSGSATPAKHGPTASLSELLRHDTLARAERSELQRWEEGSAPSTSRPGSIHVSEGADPFHPTESTFGGIERRTDAGGTPQRAGAHRLRASLGPHGGAPYERDGADGVSAAAASGRRKRPLSMGGLAPAPAALDGPASPAGAAGAVDLPRELLVALQDAFDDAHDARRGVLWRLLEALDHAAGDGDEAWRAADAAVAKLAGALAAAARGVKDAHAREFPEPAGASLASAGSEREKEREKEKRRRSGFYARPEADSALLPSSSSPLRARPAAAYANFAPSPSPASFPRQAPAHAHARAGSAVVDPALAAHVQRAGLALRAAQAKMRVVLADAAAVGAVGAEGERERLLELWESVGEEVRRLEGEWTAGAEALRRVLGVEMPAKVERQERREEPLDAATPAEEAANEGEDNLNATGAVYATLDTSGAAGADSDDLVANRQAVLDAALSASLLPPGSDASSPVEEKIFEAVAGPDRRSSAGGEKLSRDERIRRMKEAREALALGRSSLESPSKGLGEGGVDAQRNMVGELREVLKELNRDKVRLDTPLPAAVPPQPQFVAPPPPVATPPPQARSLSSPPPQQTAPLPPPAQFATPPPAGPQHLSSASAPRPPAPPPARRPSQPHFVPPPTPPRLPAHAPASFSTPPPAPPAAAATTRYSTPPAAPATPGKQPTPRYVSPPPPSSGGRARAGSSAASQSFQALPPPVPSTPGKQQPPRYVAPPGSGPASRGATPQQTQTPPPQPRYGPPPVAQSPVRVAGAVRPAAVSAGPEEGEGAQQQPQRVKRPSVQTV